MCGINVIVSQANQVTMSNLQQMQTSLKHRGPDHQDTFVHNLGESTIFIGSNRLQVIDQNPQSNQPFFSADGRYALAYNGEIYNYHDLKNKLLKLGFRFNTASDTEVLLYWLIEYGESGIGQLNGMFAFVFVDLEQHKLMVSRDRHGIKPLFYYNANNILIISSEINGIIASDLVARELNEAVIPHYLSFKYAPKPATFYKNILAYEPGITVSYDKHLRSNKLQHSKTDTILAADLKTALSDAVARQLAPLSVPAIMLSGGVDSTLLLALLKLELGHQEVDTYTMVCPMGDKYLAQEDMIFARKAAKQFHSNHHEVEVGIDSLTRMNEFMQIMDQPVADSGAFATWLVTEKAVKQHKVLFSGAGADEIFAGYNRHWAFNFYLHNRSKWWFGLLKQAGKLPQNSAGLNHLHKLSAAIDNDPSITYRNFLTFTAFTNADSSEPLWEPQTNIEGHLEQAILHDQLNYLVSDVLTITDRASMKNSLEIRVPFLDNEVVNYAAQFSKAKLLERGRKWMLGDLLSSYGGKNYVKRKKAGFGLPTSAWFRDKQTTYLWSFMDKDAYVFDFVHKPLISRLLTDHKSGKKNNSLELWSVLVLQQWLESAFP